MKSKTMGLAEIVQGAAAIRRIRRMQPTGGPGDKIFPPTYPGDRTNDPPRHVFERRRVDGKNVLCVLIDSPQSQANRLEEALGDQRTAGSLSFPAIGVDFSGTSVPDIGIITSLDAPHRVFDAIIRDSEYGGTPFKETDEGKRLVTAKLRSALPIYELSPTALVFGAWNSTGEGGGLGAKFPRTVVSEIVGVGVATDQPVREGEVERPSGQRTGSRVDPLGIRSAVRVYRTPDGNWSIENRPRAKEVRPSEVNHSNIAPSVEPLGVSVDYALQTFVISCAALRRLRFVDDPEANAAARGALAGLALLSALAQDETGYFLRSRCDLVPEGPADFEIVRSDGSTETFGVSLEDAAELTKSTVDQAASLKVQWRDSDLILTPQAKLVELVEKSRELALHGETEAQADS